MVVRGWVGWGSLCVSRGLCGLNCLLAAKEATCGLSYQFSQMCSRREKEVVGLENCQQSNIRNGVRLFITLELQWITLVIKILRSDSVVDLMIDYFVYSPTHRSTCLKKWVDYKWIHIVKKFSNSFVLKIVTLGNLFSPKSQCYDLSKIYWHFDSCLQQVYILIKTAQSVFQLWPFSLKMIFLNSLLHLFFFRINFVKV